MHTAGSNLVFDDHRLEDAIMAIVASGDKSLITPDIGGTGTTASFTNAVIKTVQP